MAQPDKKFERANRRMVLSVYDCVGTLIVALIVLSLILAYAFRVVAVDGDSMLPSLRDGDKLLLTTYNHSYSRGDVIVVDRYTDAPLIKRVIAIGGDTLSITEGGTVVVNGEEIKESYIQGRTVLNDFSGEIQIPCGYLFVMGDNRSFSKDSRSAEIGLISEKDVVGQAVCRIWPPSSLGVVKK